jgi:hypothetical protein
MVSNLLIILRTPPMPRSKQPINQMLAMILSLIIHTVAMLATPANAWTKPPVLMGPDAPIPLLLQCFEDNGFPCSLFETVAAAYRDKDTDSRLAGNHHLVTDRSDNTMIVSVYMKDGKVEFDDSWYSDYTHEWLLPEGYNETIPATTYDALNVRPLWYRDTTPMFLPKSDTDTSNLRAAEAARHEGYARIEVWAMDTIPASIRRGVTITMQEVQCGDPECAPIDTAVAIMFPR